MMQLSEVELQSLGRSSEILQTLQACMAIEHAPAFLLIAVRQGLSVQDLADALKVPQSTASRYVKALVGYEYREGSLGKIKWQIGHRGYGLVDQKINEQEPRKRSLVLTEYGLALVRRLQAVAAGTPDAAPMPVGQRPADRVIRISDGSHPFDEEAGNRAAAHE